MTKRRTITLERLVIVEERESEPGEPPPSFDADTTAEELSAIKPALAKTTPSKPISYLRKVGGR